MLASSLTDAAAMASAHLHLLDGCCELERRLLPTIMGSACTIADVRLLMKICCWVELLPHLGFETDEAWWIRVAIQSALFGSAR
ncbi:hypothetical protein ACLOJK_005743 [Asimina triloba]